MYQILFIDDEPLALEGLKHLIDWEKFGFKVIDFCNNGESGIESIKKYSPDLVITDICMPGINGLDLIEYTKANISNNIEFIILTGYSDFPYAKRAIKYGVKYFLLKPLFQEDMEDAITKIKFEFDKKAADNNTYKADTATIMTEALARTIHGNSDDEDYYILEKLKNDSSNIKAWCYVKVILKPSDSINTSFDFTNKNQYEDNLLPSIYVVEKSPEFLGIIIGFTENKKSIVESCIEDLKIKLRNLQFEVHLIAVGDIVSDITAIASSYISTMHTISYKFFTENEDILYYSSFKNEILNFMPYNIDYCKLIIEALEDLDREKLQEVINETFKSFAEKLLAPEIIVMFAVNVIYRTISIVNNLGGDTEELKSNYLSLLKRKEYLCIEKLKDMLLTFCLHCCECIEDIRKHNHQDIGLKIEELLKENYKNNIKIKEISNELHMNTAYLGQLINKRFGMSFNEYINNLRIIEAKKLISTTNMKMYEIAEAVGYSDYKGFFQQFEKITHMKPQEYKNSLNK